MPADLCIQLEATNGRQVSELSFAGAAGAAPAAEQQFVVRFQETIHFLLQMRCENIQVRILVEAADPEYLVFQLNKKLHRVEDAASTRLSIREVEILGLIMQGYTTQYIADTLFLSYETVKTHRKNILHKSGMPNTAALISYYTQSFSDK